MTKDVAVYPDDFQGMRRRKNLGVASLEGVLAALPHVVLAAVKLRA